MRKLGVIVGSLVVLAVLKIGIQALMLSAPEQDNCSFGSVSNAEYRRLLAESKRRAGSEWPSLNKQSYFELEKSLEDRIEALAPTEGSSLSLKIAATHAALRAAGATFIHGWPSPTAAMFDATIKMAGPYTNPSYYAYAYELPVAYLGWFDPFVGTALVTTRAKVLDDVVPDNSSNPRLRRAGRGRIGILGPQWYDSNPRPRSNKNCPVVPEPHIARFYESRHGDKR